MKLIPRLVHEEQTLDSVNTLRAILRERSTTDIQKGRDSFYSSVEDSNGCAESAESATTPALVCILLDDHEGLQELRTLAKDCGVHLAVS